MATYSLSSFNEQVAESIQDCLRDYHELLNAPSVGCLDNYLWPSWQLNIAPAQACDQGRPHLVIELVLLEMTLRIIEESLASALGFSGGAHSDIYDSAAGLSVMAVLSDLPEGKSWEPGRFHILTLGVYVVLQPFLLVFFTGRLRHGGTAPLQPPEDPDPLPPWAYRLTAIGYPSRRIVEGDVRHALAALPHRAEPLYLSQEMTGVK